MNTRFNPTANGPLHIGHLYMALLNEHMAHDSSGKFYVRIDDNQRTHVAEIGRQKTHCYAEGMLETLFWMGIKIDDVLYQTDSETKVKKYLASSRYHIVVDHHPGTETMAFTKLSVPPVPRFPLASWITAEKVVLDHWQNVDTMIRGVELLSEHMFYMYICALLGFPFPKCYYVLRLSAGGVDISKTTGNFEVNAFREAGVMPEQIRHILRESCLIDPKGPWHVDNTKFSPKLIIRSVNDVPRC